MAQPPAPVPLTRSRPSWLRRVRRVVTAPAILLQATGWLALLIIATGSAWLLPPSNLAGDLPGDEMLGALATRSIKANRDYIIPDPAATDALRADAERQVRPVYDFDVTEGEDAQLRVEAAFALGRRALDEALASAQEPPKKGKPHKDTTPTDEELLAAGQPAYGEFIKELQAVVEETVYRELVRDRFSPTIERSVVALLRGVLAGEIASGRELLYVERANGITVRKIGGILARNEREVRDVEHIPDLAAVRTDLARLAQGLPETPGSTSGVGRVTPVLPAELAPPMRRAAALVASAVIAPNLSYNASETDTRKHAAAAAIKPVVLQYARGEKIIGDGERIEQRHLLVFRYMREQAQALDIVQVRFGAALFTGLLVLSAFQLARRTVRRFRPSKRDLVFLASALLGNLALVRASLAACELLRDRLPGLSYDVSALILPVATGTMLVRMVRSGESSIVFTLVFSPLVGVFLSANLPAAVCLVASIIAADRMGRRSGRKALPLAAFEAAIGAALSVIALSLFTGHSFQESVTLSGAAALGVGLLSPLAASIVAPIFETVFGYTSESQLAGLASLNHPVLKELIIKAPGTYHHSLIVGSLAEAAARSIGANPLLARVGGYYHDLGKADAALMYGENQKNENRLEKLPPEEAIVIVRRHVQHGLSRARQARLPRPLLDFIAQHHGTRLIGSFLARAREQAERDGRPAPDEASFRYEGPRPKTREAAILMLADAVESASRNLVDPTPERLQALVPRVVEPIVLEGEFDQCDITLGDIRHITAALQTAIVEVHGLSRVEPLRGPPSVALPGEATPGPMANTAR